MLFLSQDNSDSRTIHLPWSILGDSTFVWSYGIVCFLGSTVCARKWGSRHSAWPFIQGSKAAECTFVGRNVFLFPPSRTAPKKLAPNSRSGIPPVSLACRLCLPPLVSNQNSSITFLPDALCLPRSSWVACAPSRCLQSTISPKYPANSSQNTPHSATEGQGDAFIHPDTLEIDPSAFHFPPHVERPNSP